MRKQLDPRIPILINNNVKKNHRSFVVLVGDRGREQVPRVSARPSVLWCYKKELGFTTHRKKREAKIKRDVKRGIRELNEQSPFEIFITVTDIRYTYYKDSHKILGNTYGMCVLQDFEAITPNLLARTIETVEGGGLVVLLLKTMTSLKQLYTMTMAFLDDELNVLPISKAKDITPMEDSLPPAVGTEELKELQASLADTPHVGELVKLARTRDQAQGLLMFVEAITEKTLSSTVVLTAARGRGKSAALGLAMAAALSHGYANIFVTSPSPENLKTLFEFVFKGLDALGYEEHLDYDIAQSTNPDFNKAIYIQPEDAHVLGQAELLIIDEAAAIPLPLVRNLLGPYLVFMASTINGYEGTGRSLSLKLIQQLRESTRPSLSKDADKPDEGATLTTASKKLVHVKSALVRTLREVKLETPIRYATGDKIEQWLHSLLCLDATLPTKSSSALQGCPHPSTCELYYVSRDTLFSFHPASELFLQRMMALYVASHYKNQPNDLQLLSDAPAHHLFVLLPPLKDDESHLPEPLVVLQVALEGNISKGVIMEGLSRGFRAGGDMIPWLVSQQFQESKFAQLSGARIVRIATHPDYANMGYGSRALKALNEFYSGEYFNLDETAQVEPSYPDVAAIHASTTLQTDLPTIRSPNAMPPLLQRLSERKPESLDYLGVSYGLTPQLLREFGSVMGLSVLEAANAGIKRDDENRALAAPELSLLLTPYDLKRLESYANNMLDYHVILDLLPTVSTLYFGKRLGHVNLSAVQASILLGMGLQRKSVEDMEKELSLPVSQALALFVKLIRKITKKLVDIQKEAVGADIPLASSEHSSRLASGDGSRDLEGEDADDVNLGSTWKPLEKNIEEELDEAGDEATRALRERQRAMFDALDLSQYAIDDTAKDWSAAEAQAARLAKGSGGSTVVSVRNTALTVQKRKADFVEGSGDKKAQRGKKAKRP
ncbi:hypothetical protein ID866_1100 [Astraeus odoratus]|nr:hypothetical protein ID866_1100 [Astraeus odoratus]